MASPLPPARPRSPRSDIADVKPTEWQAVIFLFLLTSLFGCPAGCCCWLLAAGIPSETLVLSSVTQHQSTKDTVGESVISPVSQSVSSLSLSVQSVSQSAVSVSQSRQSGSQQSQSVSPGRQAVSSLSPVGQSVQAGSQCPVSLGSQSRQSVQAVSPVS